MKNKKNGVVLIMVLALFLCGKITTRPYPFPTLYFFPAMPSVVTNPVTIEGASIGRYLFYDPILSSDSTISCSSCHQQQYAFSDSPNTFSTGVNGGKSTRNALPLFNLAWSTSFFYDGSVSTLEDQISHPITAKNEMNMQWELILKRLNSNKFYAKKIKAVFACETIDSTQVKKVIAQFLRTLISYQSKFDQTLTNKSKFTTPEFNGFRLMNNQTKGDCLHCHPTDGNALITNFKFSNNGLDSIYNATTYKDKGRGGISKNEKDNGKFRIPSLRNIALTAPYMHDGRFKTLEEVLDFYSTGVHLSANVDSKMGYAYQHGVHLSEGEKHEIISFLKTLTDSVFITNKKFSNPFLK